MLKAFSRQILTQQKGFIYVRNITLSNVDNKEKTEELPVEEIDDNTLEENDVFREKEIEMKRNKSRLSNQHYNVLHNTMPYSEPLIDHHRTVKYQRKMYGIYGAQSGVYPGICWPTKQDLSKIREYDKIAFPHPIQEVMAQIKEKRKEEEDSRQQHQKDIVKKFAKLEIWKKELMDKVAKKEAEAQAVKEKKERLIEEVRRHFGFKVDPRDERFKEMLEQKERAERKALKEAKRKLRESKLIAKLQEMQTETAVENTDPKPT